VRPRQAQRVIITGASSGIGAALARHYAATGATLGLIARRRPALERLAAELGKSGEIYSLDVRDAAALAVAARDFIHRHGCPDLVIANAGVSLGTLTEHSEDIEAFQEVLDINVMGMVKVFQPFVISMRQRRSGTLVGIASVAGCPVRQPIRPPSQPRSPISRACASSCTAAASRSSPSVPATSPRR